MQNVDYIVQAAGYFGVGAVIGMFTYLLVEYTRVAIRYFKRRLPQDHKE